MSLANVVVLLVKEAEREELVLDRLCREESVLVRELRDVRRE